MSDMHDQDLLIEEAARELDPRTVELEGINLIEASAGTGKTFNIAALFVRLLLERRLGVDQILVVTFTEAATEELRERIRARLRDALVLLRGEAGGDPLLAGIVADCRQDEPQPEELERHLTRELRRFDEAAIYTIHGFCRRLLQQSAFEAGALFQQELLEDDRELLLEVVEDAWRRWLAEDDEGFLGWLRDRKETPERLAAELRYALSKPYAEPVPEVWQAPQDLEAAQQAYGGLRQQWQDEREAVARLLREASEAGILRKDRYGPKLEQHLQALDEFLAPERFSPARFEQCEAFKYFCPTILSRDTYKAHQDKTPQHAFFSACEAFAERHRGLNAALLAHWVARKRELLEQAAQELRRRKQQRQVQGFDDLLIDVRQALRSQPELAARLHQRYPVALIDEFQDTDPTQYEIFEAIYGPGDGVLFLIGDPKQAIYSFRGGDIYTYMRARRRVAAAGRIYTLATNWRSAPGLIQAVNALFGQGEAPFGYSDIPFVPVRAARLEQRPRLSLEGAEPCPLELWLLPPGEDGARPNAEQGRAVLAAETAAEIQRLLALAEQGRARLGERPLAAEDIAVLVRTHSDGRLVREALQQLGVRSVEYAQDSLFDSLDARELERLLRAIAEPADEAAVRAALATGLLGQDALQLHRLSLDEAAWEQWLERFQDYHLRWLHKGFIAMFGELLRREGVPERLLAAERGERRLTNLLHLAEVLQQAANRRRLGVLGLVKWLAEQRDPQRRSGETEQLRLESDEGLVKIVTVHKSKGLQYPVVFCPFLWRESGRVDSPFLFHGEAEEGRIPAYLELGAKDLPGYEEAYQAHRTIALREQALEAVRLAYVALTRAEHYCVVGFGAIGGRGKKPASADSALGGLLGLEAAAYADAPALAAGLRPLLEAAPGCIELRTIPQRREPVQLDMAVSRPELAARPFQGRIPRDWRITSFTGLFHGRHPELPDYDAWAEAEPTPGARRLDLFGFPRGARAGIFLHKLLELVDFTGGRQALEPLLEQWLPRYGYEPEWLPVLAEGLAGVLATPLNAEGLRLADVPTGDRLNEFEFHYPLARISPEGLRRVFAGHPAAVPEIVERVGRLQFVPQRGFMKGFIDLVYRAGGRYYLADYKSNHLGDDYPGYQRQRLPAVMAAQHYDLQYYIYCLALHRYLRQRLPDYDYTRDFGGVQYLFLRGMHPARGPDFGVFTDRPAPALIEALDAYLAEGDGGAE